MITLIIDDKDSRILTEDNEKEVRRHVISNHPADAMVKVYQDGSLIDELLTGDLFEYPIK